MSSKSHPNGAYSAPLGCLMASASWKFVFGVGGASAIGFNRSVAENNVVHLKLGLGHSNIVVYLKLGLGHPNIVVYPKLGFGKANYFTSRYPHRFILWARNTRMIMSTSMLKMMMMGMVMVLMMLNSDGNEYAIIPSDIIW